MSFPATSRLIQVAAALCCMTASIHGTSALAGTYTHQACPGGSLLDSSGGWSALPPAAPSGETRAEDRCASGGGLFAQVAPYGPPLPAGAGAGWQYATPSGTKVRSIGFDLEGWVTTYEGMSTQIAVVVDGSTLKSVESSGASTIVSPRRIDVGSLSANSVHLLVRCASGGPACFAIYPLGHAAFRSISVTLNDDSSPAVIGPTGGTLITDAVLDGNETVDLSATDSGGGVKELQVFVDGGLYTRSPVAGGSCATSSGSDGSWVFSSPRPCPLNVSIANNIDTRQVADGAHAIAVKLVDAAGNATTVFTGKKTVANNPPVNTALPSFARSDLAAAPILGEPLRAEAGTWSGPGLSYTYEWQRCGADGEQCMAIPDATAPSYSPIRADEGKRLRVAVTARNVVAVTKLSALTGTVRAAGPEAKLPAAAGSANGTASGGQPCTGDSVRLVAPALPGAKVTLRYLTRTKVRVRLTCATDGRPIAGAMLQTSTHVPGRADSSPGRLSTASDGTAVLSLDGRSSRTILVSYRLNAADERSIASLSLRARVRGRMTLTVSKRGSAARFHGRVLGGRIPARGVALQLQWRDGRRWRPVAGITTDRTGRYRHLYRFSSRAAGFRYAFRVVVTPGQTDYPFLPARSPIRRAGR